MGMRIDVSKFLSDVAEREQRLKAALEKTRTRSILRKVSDELARIVVKRTRLGYGVAEMGGEKQPLKRLSPRYVRQRERARRRRDLDSTTTPMKSNLTFSGQLLASVKTVNVGGREANIGPTGMRKRSRLSNLKVGQYVTEKGRPWLNVSAAEERQIIRFYRNLVNDFKNL